jgi:hypothetical protein
VAVADQAAMAAAVRSGTMKTPWERRVAGELASMGVVFIGITGLFVFRGIRTYGKRAVTNSKFYPEREKTRTIMPLASHDDVTVPFRGILNKVGTGSLPDFIDAVALFKIVPPCLSSCKTGEYFPLALVE